MADRSISTSFPLAAAYRTVRAHYKYCLYPTVVCTVLAGMYAGARPRIWRASQALLVREEASAGLGRQGRFDNSDAMKTAQETIVQVSRNPAVVAAALQEVGPPPNRQADAEFPAEADIERLQAAIAVSPPKGGEFGRNEVVVLSVEGESPERAVQLVREVVRQLDLHVQQLRDQKAQSIVAELEQGVALAKAELEAATARLESTERSVGQDLGELRTLNEDGSGDSNLRSAFNKIQEEIRTVRATHEANEEMLRLLKVAGDDPQRLQTAPPRVFESQPGLRRFEEGLVDARLRVAQLSARLNDGHPELKAAKAAEKEVRSQLERERDHVIRNLGAELEVSARAMRSQQEHLAEVESRMNRLASLRARYGNEVAAVRQRSDTLLQAQQEISSARASQAAAGATSVLTRVDEATADRRPVGLSTAGAIATGVLGGLALGLALVFLATPSPTGRGRRWSDLTGFGRRTNDRPPEAVAPPTPGAAPIPVAPGAADVPRSRRATDRVVHE